MSIAIIQYPKKTVNGNTSTVSKWNAVHHAIGFQYQRQDRQVHSCTYDAMAGRLVVQIYGTVEGAVGDTCYIASGLHKGLGIIDEITFSGTPYSILKLIWFSSVTTTQLGGFLNFNSYRKNYYTITNVLGVNASGAYYTVGQSINKPDSTGLIMVDCREYLKSLVDYRDNFQYNVLNWKDDALGGKFNIVYSENWTGEVGAFSGISSTLLYYFVNSTKQIQQRYGSNVGEHVPFHAYDTDDERALFLSDFKTPTFFPGFPFSLSFIYSDGLAGVNVVKHEKKLDVNKAEIAEVTAVLSATQQQAVNRLMLSLNAYPSDVHFLDVWLETDTAGSGGRPFVVAGYVTAGYVEVLSGLDVVHVDDGIYVGPR